VNHCHRLDDYYQNSNAFVKFVWRCYGVFKKVVKVPFVISYKKAIKKAVSNEDFRENVYPTMMPNWDHTPRSNDGGSVLHNATPSLFENHALAIIQASIKKEESNQIVFLKSWNEWGEGNYMEPDIKFGRGYINALRRVLDSLNIEE